MNRYCRNIASIVFFTVVSTFIPSAQAGMEIEIADPLYFEREHKVIFPWADVKLVAFEFSSVINDEIGKQQAKKLHDLFLRKIQGLPGGAILSYISPTGQIIDNYRFKAKQVAVKQKAQMALWGRILVDKDAIPLINAHLILVESPPGISTDYQHRVHLTAGKDVPVKGMLTDPITRHRIDFKTIKNDVAPLAEFLSGLGFYYKGAKESNTNASRLLKSSVEHFKEYLRQTKTNIDTDAASVAHLYLARGHFLLARRHAERREARLNEAELHARTAMKLNPYETDTYTVQSIIYAEQHTDLKKIRELLAQAVLLAPTDVNAKYNLALVQSSNGKFKEALHQIDNAAFVKSRQDKQVPAVYLRLKKRLELMGKRYAIDR